eukprot:Blabericola_migrator_1__4474@NODE_2390_length_2842_cov_91_682883_g1496_i0_p1_GENE_NODE_2390_length_2842_cov_91_682883_g1496_i0NODE_2390_length_2842_cov_91_682883_g1496_i0_p1_ORF_typecomplete_len375_score37_33_NODE_2390_length_2842_cov_91_682883_g1496_i013822506
MSRAEEALVLVCYTVYQFLECDYESLVKLSSLTHAMSKIMRESRIEEDQMIKCMAATCGFYLPSIDIEQVSSWLHVNLTLETLKKSAFDPFPSHLTRGQSAYERLKVPGLDDLTWHLRALIGAWQPDLVAVNDSLRPYIGFAVYRETIMDGMVASSSTIEFSHRQCATSAMQPLEFTIDILTNLNGISIPLTMRALLECPETRAAVLRDPLDHGRTIRAIHHLSKQWSWIGDLTMKELTDALQYTLKNWHPSPGLLNEWTEVKRDSPHVPRIPLCELWSSPASSPLTGSQYYMWYDLQETMLLAKITQLILDFTEVPNVWQRDHFWPSDGSGIRTLRVHKAGPFMVLCLQCTSRQQLKRKQSCEESFDFSPLSW